MKKRLYHFPKWLLNQKFQLHYFPAGGAQRFHVKLEVGTGFGKSIAKAAKNARGTVKRKRRDCRTLPGAPDLRFKKSRKQTGQLVAAVRYKI